MFNALEDATAVVQMIEFEQQPPRSGLTSAKTYRAVTRSLWAAGGILQSFLSQRPEVKRRLFHRRKGPLLRRGPAATAAAVNVISVRGIGGIGFAS